MFSLTANFYALYSVVTTTADLCEVDLLTITLTSNSDVKAAAQIATVSGYTFISAAQQSCALHMSWVMKVNFKAIYAKAAAALASH